MSIYLMHWICEERFQRPSLQAGFFFEASEDRDELLPLFAFGQDLQAVVMIPHVLLIDGQHGQQHVEEISWDRGQRRI